METVWEALFAEKNIKFKKKIRREKKNSFRMRKTTIVDYVPTMSDKCHKYDTIFVIVIALHTSTILFFPPLFSCLL